MKDISWQEQYVILGTAKLIQRSYKRETGSSPNVDWCVAVGSSHQGSRSLNRLYTEEQLSEQLSELRGFVLDGTVSSKLRHLYDLIESLEALV